MFSNRKKWIILTAFALLCSFGAYKIFPKAFPILNISLDMSRSDALSKAQQLSEKFNLGPEDNFQAATFGVDGYAQSYIELDAGGSSEFINILDKKYYEAYTWKVRHYKPGDINEVWFQFTPEGNVYGFYEKLSDDLFLESLSKNDSQQLAELESVKNWNVDLLNYDLIEIQEDLKPSNRLDYTFVYKRNDISIDEEGEYRLRITVSGNKLTEVKHFIKIPETFNRKYEEMRSSNNTIASISTYAMIIFYVFGGIIIGLFVLNRERWLLWKSAVYWALFVSVLTLVSGLNYMPLSWLGYDTAVSTQNFIIQNIVISLINGIADFVLLLLSFVAAESLTRKAFPEHLQFWKLWTQDNATSYQVIGRTVGGYLLIGLDLIFVVVFYMITANYFGWWVPSSTLFSPDVVATPFPWLSAVGMSLHAGFWEECLFRAIPIAGAVLLSKKYGNRTAWILFAMILQAVIFAGAHANYPSYPSYSRLVELIIPSLFWGFIYIRFGLLPVIISHFGYDVVWFSLPLFTSTSGDLFFDKLMVILLTLIPILVILRFWLKNKKIDNISDSELNSSFVPDKIVQKEKEESEEIDLELPKYYKISLYSILLIGIITSFQYFSKNNYASLNVEISRSEALSLADKFLNDNNIDLDDSWSVLSNFYAGSIDASDRFVWQELGDIAYKGLIGSYLENNLWNIRYVRFSGDVNDKTEEYSVIINPNGSFNQIRHKVPENSEGSSLDEDIARKIAIDYIMSQYSVSEFKEISSDSSELPNRKDWSFIFSTLAHSSKSSLGEDLRVKVDIAGDKVVSSNRFVYIPESWEREDKNKMTLLTLIRTICSFIFIFLIIYAAASSLAKWSKGSFDINLFKKIFYFLTLFSVFDIINSYPSLVSDFSTAQPFINQIATGLISSLLYSLVVSFAFSAIFVSVSKNSPIAIHRFTYIEIVAIALIIICFTYRALNIGESNPMWNTGFSVINSYFPLLKNLNNVIFTYFNQVVIILFIVNMMNGLNRRFNYNKRLLLTLLLGSIFSVLFVGSQLGSGGVDSIGAWIFGSFWILIIFTSIYLNHLIYNIAMIPLLVSLLSLFDLILKSSSNAYPGIFINNIICSLIILAIGHYMYLNLLKLEK